jgi:hypothetical protein
MDSIKQKEGESELLDHFLFSRIHIEVPNKITLWDFDEFITQLKQDHVHQNYLDLLKKIPVAVVINPMRDRKSMLKPLIESQNKSNKQ